MLHAKITGYITIDFSTHNNNVGRNSAMIDNILLAKQKWFADKTAELGTGGIELGLFSHNPCLFIRFEG